MTSFQSLDLSLYHLILYAPHPDWLTRAMIFVTRPENFFLAIGVSAFFLILWGGGRGRFLVLSAGIGVAITDPLASQVIKGIFRRPRPCHGELPVHLPLGCTDSWSFPSSHATNIFCEATIVSLVFPRARPWAYLFASLVGFSRIYLGVHYPFDVLGGAGIGVLVGWGVVRLLEKMPGLGRFMGKDQAR